jgi:hypothetical protein
VVVALRARHQEAVASVVITRRTTSRISSDVRRTKGGRWHIGYDAYLEWFAGQENVSYRTDRSVFYLYSTRAAAEIDAYDPASRVVALLRNPVDQMHSQHSEMLFQGDEDISSFGDAIDAEADRKDGRRVPPGCQKVFGLFYRDIARYGDQIERYQSLFGRDRCCVVLRDDLVADAADAYRQLLGFLDVDPGHRPEFGVVNANKVIRSARLRELLRQAPPGLRRMGRMVVPDARARAALRRRLHVLNTRGRARPPMDPALRLRLVEEFTTEIRRLEGILDRDLGAWLAPATAGGGRKHSGLTPDGRVG